MSVADLDAIDRAIIRQRKYVTKVSAALERAQSRQEHSRIGPLRNELENAHRTVALLQKKRAEATPLGYGGGGSTVFYGSNA
jgi:hypothetical protein